jgi:DsbC/DsbD-like thiol-disulfide interchange protein
MRMPSAFSLVPLLALVVVSAGSAAHASGPGARQGPPQPVTWSIALEPASGRVAAGGTLTAVVTVKIDEDWHVYAPDDANDGPRPVQITVVKNPVFAASGKMDAPEPEREMDQAFGQITSSYTDRAIFRLPIAAAKDANEGAHPLELDITFQACDGRLCLPSRVTRLKSSVIINK